MFRFLSSLFSYDIAIDLGTANTLIYAKGVGVVLNEPSVITIESSTGKVLAVGAEAKKMIGRTSGHIRAVRPLKDGVIADFSLAEQMIKLFIKKVKKNSFFKRSTVVVCVPSGATPVEKKAIQESVYSAGGNKVYLIEETIAAALGANLPIVDPVGSMVVDIGGGTTEVAVLSLGGLVFSRSVRIGGDKMDEAIINYVKKHFNLNIGEAAAQAIKENIGGALPLDTTEKINNPSYNKKMKIKGINMLSGLPKEIVVSTDDAQKALSSIISDIVDVCKEVLENTPPDLAGDIVERGIVLTGGGSLLTDLDTSLSEALQIPVILSERPLESVVIGTGKAIEALEKFQYVFTQY